MAMTAPWRREADHLGVQAGGRFDQLVADLELAERIGDVGGHRIGAALGQDIDGLRLRQQGDRVFQMLFVQRARNIVERRAGGGDESVENRPVAGTLLGLGAQRRQPLVIRRIALAQALAKHQLQAGKAVEAELLGKADQGRRLNAGRGGDAGGGAEGDIVGIVERIGCNLGDTLRQALAPLRIVARSVSKSRGTRSSIVAPPKLI